MQRVRHMNQHRTGTYRACTHLRPPPPPHTHTHASCTLSETRFFGFLFPSFQSFSLSVQRNHNGRVLLVICFLFVCQSLSARPRQLSSKASCPFTKFDHQIKWLGFDKGRKTLTRSSNVHIFHGNVGLAELRWEWSVIRWPEKLEVTFLPLSCTVSLQSCHLLRMFLGSSAWMNGKMWFSQPCKKTKKNHNIFTYLYMDTWTSAVVPEVPERILLEFWGFWADSRIQRVPLTVWRTFRSQRWFSRQG